MMRATAPPRSGDPTPVSAGGYEDDADDLARYVQYFEESEQATDTERSLAERDRDYYDNKQLTDTEIKTLERRGQPAIVINRIKRKIDFLRGVEQQQRVDPKAFPRNPQDEASAHAATDALRFVTDANRYDVIRSGVWDNLLVEGLAGAEVVVEPKRNGELDIVIRRVPWDRIFRDPHSREADCSDANYLGTVLWMDYRDAAERWPDSADTLETILSSTSMGDTFDDRPSNLAWCDSKRKRVRIVQMWHRKAGVWHWCTFTRGVVLESGPSPYLDEHGEPECPLILASAYIDRKNARYGVVREMIGPQDEINKRRSKALHLLTLRQVVAEKGAVDDSRAARIELAKPDGYLEVAPNKRFEILPNGDMAAGQFQLLQHATAEIDLLGPNAAMQGKSAADQSGRAIIAQQQGGYVELGPVMDRLRQFNISVYQAIWSRIRQFWTQEKWIRVTDDERNVKFVALNKPITAGEQFQDEMLRAGVPPEQIAAEMQAMAGDPRLQQVVDVQNNVAQMYVDIVVDDAPDTISIQHEQFELIVQLVQAGVPIPPDMLIEMSQLRNKDAVLEKMRGGGMDPQAAQAQAEQQAQAQQLLMAEQGAKVRKLEAEAMRAEADAQAKLITAQKPEPMAAPAGPEPVTPLDQAEQVANIEYTQARTYKTLKDANRPAPAPQNARAPSK
jgi:hypothetical protein